MPKIDNYFSPEDDVLDHLIGFLDRCHGGIDAAVYSVTHPDIAEALIRAQERGSDVRLLMDASQAAGRYSQSDYLMEQGVSVRTDIVTGIMHHKFAVDCDLALLSGSLNWTVSATERNAESWTINRYKYVIRTYQKRFDYLWLKNQPESE